jgi:hypothetical protein
MEEFKGDKRTKAYKEWKAKFESKPKGLGDTVEGILEATGIAKVAKAVLGEDCGCDERKEVLNKMLKYKVVNCLEEDEFEYLTDFMDKKANRVSPAVQKELIKIYNRVFNRNQQQTSCSSCLRQVIDQLDKLIKNS